MIEGLRPYVQQVVDDLLAPLAGGDADLVTQFADLIPVTVVCELLGVPHEDHEQCRAWSEEIALAIEPVVPDEHLRRADAATAPLPASTSSGWWPSAGRRPATTC